MKHIKIHSFTHLLHLLYCLILALPLCTILVRCLYVEFNKNAYHSYGGRSLYELRQVESVDDLNREDNPTIVLKFTSDNVSESLTQTIIQYTNPTFLNGNLSSANIERVNDSYQILIYLAENRRTLRLEYTESTRAGTYINLAQYQFEMSVENLSIYSGSFDDIKEYLFYYSLVDDATLDNAFEYSISKFVDNSNIGRLNLVNWFTDVFLDSSNATNMLYLNFINWYMNYALLVSCVYILFLVLMWFVSLARRLIYKGMEM